MAALQAEHLLSAHEELEDGRTAQAATAGNGNDPLKAEILGFKACCYRFFWSRSFSSHFETSILSFAEDDAGTAEAVRSAEHLSTQAVALTNGIDAKENAAKNPVPA